MRDHSFSPAAPVERTVCSLSELVVQAARWDDLWRRSESCDPIGRAELIALWVRHFAPNSDFRAVVVEADGRLVAALPLVSHAMAGGLVTTGSQLTNDWVVNGDLLLDESADIETAMDRLVAGLRRLSWPIIWFDRIPLQTARWRAFIAAAERAGMPLLLQRRYVVGQVSIDGRWEDYFGSRPATLRSNCRRHQRMFAQIGGARLEVYRGTDAERAAQLVGKGWEIEDLGWKGREGTSVLRHPGMADYFCEEAMALARAGELELAFLLSGEAPVAFCYCRAAKGCCITPKSGYDPKYARFGPGQQLMMRLIERCHADGIHTLDFNGPLAEHLEKWATESYMMGRLLLSPRHLPPAAMSWYRSTRSRLRDLRGWVRA